MIDRKTILYYGEINIIKQVFFSFDFYIIMWNLSCLSHLAVLHEFVLTAIRFLVRDAFNSQICSMKHKFDSRKIVFT